jgi:tetratricopeptide (TPR) repeat protein
MQGPAELLGQAADLHGKGDLAAAEAVYLRLLDVPPVRFDALHMLGILRCQQGRFAEALSLIADALKMNPAFPPALLNYGLALDALQRHAEAVASYDRALAVQPDYAEALFRRGVALRSLQRPLDAFASFERVLAKRPDHVGSLYNRAGILRDLGRPEEALESFERASAIKPDYAEALNGAGLALLDLGRQAEALVRFERALAARQHYPAALNNRAGTLQELGRPEEALAGYDKLLELQPEHAEALYNRGIVLRDLSRPLEALASLDAALAINPRHVDALNNRGIVLRDLARPTEALASYDRALALAADNAETHVNRSCVRLLLGDFAQGWPEFEWRWRTRDFAPWRRDFAAPLWLGEESLAGRTILLHAEQGMGDALQFARYVPLVATRGARVVLEVPPPLTRLMSSVAGVAQVIGRGEALPPFDFHCPLLSLPLAFRTVRDAIPAGVPYLFPSAERAARWKQSVPDTGVRRIGLAWAGNADFKGDRSRSIGLERLSPLLSVGGVAFFSLQKDLRAGDRDILLKHPQVTPLGEAIADFDDTAAIMASLDIVISSDTSVVHLAGALGRPVWILLQQVADWRWSLDRADCPWYPTARLFRQPKLDDWESVVREVAGALAARSAQASG